MNLASAIQRLGVLPLQATPNFYRDETGQRRRLIMRMILEFRGGCDGPGVPDFRPPGCGKTTWALQRLRQHEGPCAYLRLEGDNKAGLEQGADSGIDLAWLKDQVPRLEEPATAHSTELKQDNDGLTLIEVQQFHPPSERGIEGLGDDVRSKLEALRLHPDQLLHFGRDPELPAKDTLEFSKLEAWHTSLSHCVWDPNSLSSFWLELVNGAYGDVYRAKGLMNLPDGRAFFFK